MDQIIVSHIIHGAQFDSPSDSVAVYDTRL